MQSTARWSTVGICVQPEDTVGEGHVPILDKSGCDQLLQHQFLAGLSYTMSWQLRATGENNVLYATVTWACLLIDIDDHWQATAFTDKPSGTEVIRVQLTHLSETVTALWTPSHQQKVTDLQCYWTHHFCNTWKGLVQCECPFCNQRSESHHWIMHAWPGHTARDHCPGNNSWVPMQRTCTNCPS